MKLIVGLGNPGLKYRNTRHNVGFMAVDHFLKNKNPKFKKKFHGSYFEDNINGERVIFLKPEKYMNLSGEVIRDFVKYFDIKIDDLLIIYDDISFELGKIKLKPKGSSGGHNGIKNIILHIKTNEFQRLKVGISSPDIDIKNYVLGKFQSQEKIEDVLCLIDNIISDFLNVDFVNLMNKYN